MLTALKRWRVRLPQPVADTSSLWRYALWGVIGLYFILALAQSFWVTVFEGSDEQRHYAYARYLVNHLEIPPRPTAPHTEFYTYQVAQEAGQPPLYYLLVALITAPVPGADDVDAYTNVNWFMSTGDYQEITNDNHTFYLPTTEGDFPWHGTALAVHLGRLLSVVAGVITLLGVHAIARTIFPNLPAVAVLATAFMAFAPQFIFLHATITNDVPVIAFTTLSMLVAVRIIRAGPTPRLVALGGLCAALTILSKFNGMWVLGALVMAIVGSAWLRRKDTVRSSIWLALGLLGVVVLLLCGWWFVYGFLQNGDPLGVALHTSKAGQGPSSIVNINSSLINLKSLAAWELTTWYSVAWGQINAPVWFTDIFRILYRGGLIGALLAGAVALARALKSRRVDGALVLQVALIGYALVCIIVLAILWQSTGNNKLGRYLYPGLTSVATVISFGWVWYVSLLRRVRWQNAVVWIGALSLGAVLIFSAVWSTYNTLSNLLPHPLIRPMPADAIHTDVVFLDPEDDVTPVAAVAGYRISQTDLRPGSILTADLCWRSYSYSKQELAYSLQVVGPNDTRYGTRNSYHGLGSYPILNWSANDVFCDPTSVTIGFAADRPRAYHLLVGLFPFDATEQKVMRSLRTIDGDGHTAYPVIGRVRVAPATMPVVTPTVNVGDLAGLVDWHTELRAGNTLSVTLRWVAIRPDGHSAKVFLHVLDADGKMIAQHDHEPDGGWFPTAYWLSGDVVEDSFEVQLPAGTDRDKVQLRVGMYDAQTQQRLPAVRITGGARYQDDLIPLGE